jgi:uncharacterized repeat protein (TIGR03803 family)
MSDSILIHKVGRCAITVLAMALVLMLVRAPLAQAQQYTYTKLHDFTGSTDGAYPYAGLVMDSTGKLYGTTEAGGARYGTVFRLVNTGSGWVFAPLYDFAGAPDGAFSDSRVLVASDGSLYGATSSGGNAECTASQYGCGTVFNLKPKPSVCRSVLCFWDETQLYRFDGGDGGSNVFPYGDLTTDASGNLYGGAAGDPSSGGCGLIYELVNGTWTENVLYTFSCGNDGFSPLGGVVFDKSGNLYGPTYGGGQYSNGVIFELTPSGSGWTQNVIYAFQGRSDGGIPIGGLIFDAAGNMYGTTSGGGENGGGTVFELSQSGGGWTFTVLCNVSYTSRGGPQGNLVMDSAGNLYGASFGSGANQQGSVFKATFPFSDPDCTDIYSFTGGTDGGGPYDGLALDASGNLYGTASNGGNKNRGVVFELTP